MTSELKKVDQQVESTKKHLGSLKDQVNKFGSGFGSNFSEGFLSGLGLQRGSGAGALMGGAAANLITGGAKALFGHVTDAIQQGMTMRDVIEQQKIAFTSLTGAQETAISHMKEMFEMGAKTAFRTPELLEYSQKLQSVGVNFRNVKEEMTDFGDAMAKAGSFHKMDKLMNAIVQIRSKGRLYAEEWTGQIGDALPGATALASRATGLSSGEFMKAISEGRIKVEPFLELLRLQMRKESAGMMEQIGLSTLEGLESTLADTKMMTYAHGVNAGDPFGPAGGAYLQRMNNLRQQISNYGGPEAKNVAEIVGKNAEWYYWGVGKLEENAFKKAHGKETVEKMFTDPKGAAQDIWKGLTEGIGSGLGIVQEAGQQLGKALYAGFDLEWLFGSPSKKAIKMGEWIREGLDIGLNKKQAGNYANLQKLSEQSPDFMRKLGEVAGRLGTDPDYLLNVFARESSLNPNAYNASGASGLFQLMPMHARKLGLPGGPNNKDAFRQAVHGAGPIGQLDLFYRYISEIVGVQNFKDQASAYAAVFMPKYVNSPLDTVIARQGTKNYRQNTGLDQNKDGLITKRELGAEAEGALGAGKFFSVNGQPIVNKSNPMPVEIVASALAPIYYDPNYNDQGLSNQIGNARGMYAARRLSRVTSALTNTPLVPGMITDSVPVNVDIAISKLEEPIESFGVALGANALQFKRLQGVTKQVADLEEQRVRMLAQGVDVNEIDQRMARLRQSFLEEAAQKRRAQNAFGREGVAGDFQGGLASLLGNLGWEGSPGSLGKQFLFNLARDGQSRIGQDISRMLTASLFGTADDDGKLSGGLFGSLFDRNKRITTVEGFEKFFQSGGISGGGNWLSKIFGSLFGGFRASGGMMSAGRFYMAGEHGPELVSGPGYVHNASDTRAMLGDRGETQIMFAIGDREIESMTTRALSGARARRAMIRLNGRHGRKTQASIY